MKNEAYVVIETGIAIPLSAATMLSEAVRVDSRYDGGYVYTIATKNTQPLDFKILPKDYVAGMIAEHKLK